jgi:hypothetical protein
VHAAFAARRDCTHWALLMTAAAHVAGLGVITQAPVATVAAPHCKAEPILASMHCGVGAGPVPAAIATGEIAQDTKAAIVNKRLICTSV